MKTIKIKDLVFDNLDNDNNNPAIIKLVAEYLKFGSQPYLVEVDEDNSVKNGHVLVLAAQSIGLEQLNVTTGLPTIPKTPPKRRVVPSSLFIYTARKGRAIVNILETSSDLAILALCLHKNLTDPVVEFEQNDSRIPDNGTWTIRANGQKWTMIRSNLRAGII